MIRTWVLVIALALRTVSALSLYNTYPGPGGTNCSAPALWRGVARNTTKSASKTAAQSYKKKASVWVAYMCGWNGVYVYDVLGQTQWSSSTLSSDVSFAPSFGADGSVFATSTTAVAKFDLLTGTQLWMQDQYDDSFVGPAQVTADVVYVPYAGGYAVLTATTGIINTSLSDVSNLVTNGNYSAGLTDETLQFYFNGQPVSSPNLDDSVQAPTAANGDVFCASQVIDAVVGCVNTKKAPSYSYQFTLGTSLPFAIAGDDLVIGIDSSTGNAQICQGSAGGGCWAMRSRSPYTFAAGVSGPPLPVPRNASSCVIFGAAETQEDGKSWLVGFDLSGDHYAVQLKSIPVGLPAAVFDEESQTTYVAITKSDTSLYVYTDP